MRATADMAGSDDAWQAPAATAACGGVLRLPGSKSMTSRALVLAALADGPTLITGPLRARDTVLMTAALRELGAAIEPDGPAVPQRPGAPQRPGEPERTGAPEGPEGAGALRVMPGGPAAATAAVDVGNAGTVLRFVPPVAALTPADVRFTGDPRAAQRPAAPLLDGLRELGAVIDGGGNGSVPFTVRGRGALRGGRVTLDASASSQLVSGLLLAAPRYDKGVEIRHEGPPVPSAPHLAMTAAMLRAAGAEVSECSQAGDGGRPGSRHTGGCIRARWRRGTSASSPTCPTRPPSWPQRW